MVARNRPTRPFAGRSVPQTRTTRCRLLVVPRGVQVGVPQDCLDLGQRQSLDLRTTAAQVVARYAGRWSIEPSNAAGKQQMGVGQARNRPPKAVQRTVPFGMLVQSMVIVWYALHGYHPDDVTEHRQAEPWYQTKTEPSFKDMLTKLRKTLIAARFSTVSPAHSDPELLRDYAPACAAAAA